MYHVHFRPLSLRPLRDNHGVKILALLHLGLDLLDDLGEVRGVLLEVSTAGLSTAARALTWASVVHWSLGSRVWDTEHCVC